MRKFKRLTMTLALLIAAVGGAWADEEPQLLTTINASSSFLTGSQTFDDIATVTFGGAGTVAFNDKNGWVQAEYQKEATVTVTAVDGYTITSIKIYSADPQNATISTSPFTAYLNCWGATYVTTGSGGAGDYIGDELVKIEVYGYQSEPEITEWELKPDDTGKNWILADMPASNIELQVEYYAESNLFLSKEALADKTSIAVKAGDLGVQFGDDGKSANTVTEGSAMTVTYNGAKKVLGMKVAKKVENAYLKWDADQKKLVATEMPAEVTTVANSNENVSWQAGTYVVDGEVNISGTITLSGDVNLIIKDGAKLTAQRISGAYKNLSIYGQAIQTGQLVVDNSGNDAIYGITTLEVHSAKVTATSSGSNRGGFFNIGTINVYGGSVDATATGDGYGISLNGSMDIYGGEVKAVGKGTSSKSYGFMSGSSSSTVTVYGGKLWAENADDKALKYINLEKGAGFTGKIETSDDNQSWDEYTDAETPTNKYVRVGY